MFERSHFELWVDRRVLLARISGQWNIDIAERYTQAFKQVSQPLLENPAPWAHFVYLDNWELGTPEMEPVIKSLSDWAAEHQLKYSANLYSENMLKDYQLSRMVNSSADGFERRAFKVKSEAFAWLADNGFEVEYQDIS